MPAPNENDPLTDSTLCTGDPLAQALAVLEPMPAVVNRDQLMFAAGAARRECDVRFWKRIVFGQTTAACLLVGVGLATYDFQPGAPTRGDATPDLARRPADPPRPTGVAQRPLPAPAPEPATPSTDDESDETANLAKYLRLRANILTLGVNALPKPNAPGPNVDVGSIEDSLQLPRGTFAIHGWPAKAAAKPDHDD